MNQNHVNNKLITIMELDVKLKLPVYYSPAFPCNLADADTFNTQGIKDAALDLANEKLINTSGGIPQIPATVNDIMKSYPSKTTPFTPITQSQIYTVNEILKNNSSSVKTKAISSNPKDLLAVIILNTNRLAAGNYMTENGSALQENRRTYFGPITLSRLKVRLVDDKGNVVNLNGLDFNFTLIAETLYQY
jgi:hypothetical protein